MADDLFPVLVGPLTLVDALLLLAPLAVVPLGLALVPLTTAPARRVVRLARILQPLGALAAVVSFLLPAGTTAAILAGGWLAVCALAGVAGVTELVCARSVRPPALLPAAALGFLTVGGAWMVANRSGLTLGYGPVVAELTAVHFHYAGFVATLMSALAISVLLERSPRLGRLGSAAGLLVVLGTPLTAAGFATGTAVLMVVGPALLVAGVLITAGLTAFVVAPRVSSPVARWLLIASAAAVVVPMLLGLDYAAARVLPVPSLDLRAMAIVHGDLNAIVYALVGLAGWALR
ncbi:MAG: hypothetical protein E6J28_11065 [Chloroflexi bacterium]|nr:MAG: hypothetical protein E6J28_11065 [Chloroflexota bacterium]